jgi:hypothetical protein
MLTIKAMSKKRFFEEKLRAKEHQTNMILKGAILYMLFVLFVLLLQS